MTPRRRRETNRLRADGTSTITIGKDAVVYLRGEGATVDSADAPGTVRNEGRIVADGTSNTVFIDPATFENSGVIEVRNSAITRTGGNLAAKRRLESRCLSARHPTPAAGDSEL